MPSCNTVDDETPAPASAAALIDSGADDSPAPRLRGNWRGFLPDGTVNDLRASAASGAGLAAMPPVAVRHERDKLLLGLALLGLYLALTRK